MTTEKKRGRGRPKGAPNKPLMELVTERKNLMKDADAYEILCQANIVAEEDVDKASHGLKYLDKVMVQSNHYCNGCFHLMSIQHYPKV